MKKHRIIISSIVLIFFIFFLVPSVHAQADRYDEQYDDGIETIQDSLPKSVRDSISGGDFRTVDEFGTAVENLISSVVDGVKEQITGLSRLVGLVAASLILCSFISGAVTGKQTQTGKTVNAVCTLAAVASVAAFTSSLASDIASLMSTSQVFLSGFVPVFTGVMISIGKTASTAVYASAVTAIAAVASAIASSLIRPVVGVILGLSAVSSLNDGAYFSLAAGLKKSVVWVLGIITTIFIGIVGLKTAIAATGDGLASRTAKYLIGSTIPIVGTSVNEAVSTIQGSLSVVRTGLGTAGIVGLCAIYIPPLIKCVLTSAAVSLCAIAADILGLPQSSRGITMMKNGIDVITSVIGFNFLALTVCTAVMLRLGVS